MEEKKKKEEKKAPTDDVKKKTRSDSRTVIIGILIATIIIVLIDAACIAIVCWLSINGSAAGETTQSLEASLLSTGLSIIGIAVAVWAGLNIVNAIERKDLEELQNKSDHLKQQIADTISNMESIAYDGFLQALLRVGSAETGTPGTDEANVYFYREFSKHTINTNEDYFTLTRIENLFGQVYSLHNTEDHLDLELIEKAEEALGLIDGFQTADQLVKTYLSFRKAEFNYYCGYVGDGAHKQYQFFSEAIDLYLDLSPKMGVVLPHYQDQKNDTLPECPENANRKLAIYMANTVGDACSKIIPLGKKLPERKASDDERVSTEKPKDYEQMALFYCGCAAKWADGYDYEKIRKNELQYFELYYRNYGVALERYDKTHNVIGEHAGKILENYQKAFYHIVKGTKVRAQRLQSVYHVLLSYLKIYFDKELDFDGNNGALKIFDSKEAFDAACKYNYALSDEQLKYLETMVDVSELAITHLPLDNIPHVMNGFAYSYVLLLKLVEIENVCKQFPEENHTYLAKMEAALSSLRTLNIDDNYTKSLKNRYDLLKEKVEAADWRE